MTPAIRFLDVSKIYSLRSGDVTALDNVTLSIEEGEFIAVMGPSGSGKSTLLNMMGCLDTPTKGQVFIGERNIGEMTDDELTMLRREHLGFIFQQFNLIPLLSAIENVRLPLILKGGDPGCTDRCMNILAEVGIEVDRLDHTPAELSGGQQQRVAIARALINDPEVLLADEPTGNLDTKTGAQIMDLLVRLQKEEGKTIIMVTHDPTLSEYADRVIRIVDGRIA
ncbi:ABC transporter ATP-binding protein [Methanocalculus chunghsingensis]|uniref:ABC transporter ATP-binding protein n=1 Tax=Methanocalculus chunghsingensis TaxID=156457 RepID=A0A8J8B4U1_9EURY|nr:ABC transporter ATP-binding protein [Methanocalculus chunghsingensis]MBR1369071.1 ABC transporter ATP-binding protein [Methanocalculus chunghsingensis]